MNVPSLRISSEGKMADILILFSSTDGHTIKICNRLKQVIEESEDRVTVRRVDDFREIDLRSFDKIVVGASIRYGRHGKPVFDFIKSNLPLLEAKSNAFFSVNIVARKPEKNQPETNPYLRKFLGQVVWRPGNLEVFAGKLDYPSYGFLDRLMIRLIMWITGGPTAPTTVVEFTDWQRVDDFARRVSAM
jgi:menaquinone-dependent protoporphyrinogen oxidase